MEIKPVCNRCKRPFLVGKRGTCQACLKPGGRYKRLRCYCGRLAEYVIVVNVLNPEELERKVQLALCQDCLDLERQLEIKSSKPTPTSKRNDITLLVVKRIPHADTPLKGRKIA